MVVNTSSGGGCDWMVDTPAGDFDDTSMSPRICQRFDEGVSVPVTAFTSQSSLWGKTAGADPPQKKRASGDTYSGMTPTPAARRWPCEPSVAP